MQLSDFLSETSRASRLFVTHVGESPIARCHAMATSEEHQASLADSLPEQKNYVTSKSPVGDIPVVTLIRTDTTLDHSQKAEKVCILLGCRQQGFLNLSSAEGKANNARGF